MFAFNITNRDEMVFDIYTCIWNDSLIVKSMNENIVILAIVLLEVIAGSARAVYATSTMFFRQTLVIAFPYMEKDNAQSSIISTFGKDFPSNQFKRNIFVIIIINNLRSLLAFFECMELLRNCILKRSNYNLHNGRVWSGANFHRISFS